MNIKGLLHLATEFAPSLVFFIASQFYPFFTATAIFIATTALALALGAFVVGRLPIFPIAAAAFVLVAGVLTLVYREPDAIIIADSIYYFLFATIIAGGLFARFNILKRIFNNTFAMRDEGWDILAMRWIIILVIAGVANEIVRAFLAPEDWVDFRFIKVLSLGVAILCQFTLSRRYRIPEESNAWGMRTSPPPAVERPKS
jgi:intracellular septation protein